MINTLEWWIYYLIGFVSGTIVTCIISSIAAKHISKITNNALAETLQKLNDHAIFCIKALSKVSDQELKKHFEALPK